MYRRIVHQKLMVSLRGFTRLKHIKLFTAMFFNRTTESGKKLEIDRNLGDTELNNSVASVDGTFLAVPLVDVMPASLETLTLVGPLTRSSAKLLFSGMAALKKERPPNLREVNLSRRISVHRWMQNLCDELAVILKSA